MRTPHPSSLKERCAATRSKFMSDRVVKSEWLVGQALRHRKWTEDALADLAEAAKLCAVILVEEYGARENGDGGTQ